MHFTPSFTVLADLPPCTQDWQRTIAVLDAACGALLTGATP
ncbi:hypothetical protein [Oceaniovalibus sp. ACAM 378]|nr:hypothetical protein [Oceaniovalibus sp. ACAM 378]